MTKIINSFPGYELIYDSEAKVFKNMYRGVDVGFGGYVYAEPRMYGNVALLDVRSMHPKSAVLLNIFGEYTKKFEEILQARIAIKDKDFDTARKMLGGSLAKYLDDESAATALSTALKIAINSVYGLTSASFDNPFRDKRNKNNIVALRGALFMKTLEDEVKKKGYKVAHIKTDSIKIPDATPEIIKFVCDFGEKYGYEFEHEATYDRMCLVNNSVYIAKYSGGKEDGKWTAVGTQFAVPYVFKTLFSKEPIIFEDLCETKAVTSSIFLDMNETLPPNEHDYHFVGRVGRFCPVKDGQGGGMLMREKDGKYNSVTGTKGYRWLESEVVEKLGKKVDESYYVKMVDEAKETIESHGELDWFINDTKPYSKHDNGILPF